MAARYVELTRELARHDPSLLDHWLTSPPAPAAGGRQPVSTLQPAVEALAADVAAATITTGGGERARAMWLQGQLRALQLATRRLLGDAVPFDTEARVAFDLTPRPVDRDQVDRAHRSLERELPGSGPLAARLAAFRTRFHVAPAAREAVMRVALEACREATADALPLPADESVDIAFVEGLPWDAHARYLGAHRTRVDVNASQPLDLTRALRLACHEGYAGHHVQHIWSADDLVARRGWAEHALVPGFGPALLLAEGAADAGTHLAMPPEHRLWVYRERLSPAAGLSRVTPDDIARLVRVEEAQAALEPVIGVLARDYLDNRLTATATAERLEQDVLMSGAETFVSFIERRRARILAYTEGRRVVLERLGPTGLTGLRDLFVPPTTAAGPRRLGVPATPPARSAKVPPCNPGRDWPRCSRSPWSPSSSST